IQTWSPFQYGFMEGVFLGSEKFAALNKVLEEVGARYGVSSTTISLAWILRHPAKMQAVVGSINPKRIIECAKAAEIELSRADWYEIYRGAGHRLP
ncbi:MAG: aldo/keto reductase, partial [Acutalibacteraceae bacterium]